MSSTPQPPADAAGWSSVAITPAEITRRMGYHPARGGQPELYEEIRARFMALGEFMVDRLPQGRDLSSAVDKLADALRATIAVVACNDVAADDPPAR